ncbi:MAG: DNA-protecting protein DprA [Clostridiales bacterium]|nr:DNA-protecting protein DprA [Clostridiales bacterium]
MKIEIIRMGEAAYPERLLEIKNPPKQIYCCGDLELLKSRCVAVVGSRTTTVYGRRTAEAIGRCLAAAGVTVVSGMAIGIDASAHEGALSAGGLTVAVLGCGPDVCYPPENRLLMADIKRRGLIVTEYEPGTPANRYNFPNRNRIISGLCEATVVVQARNRSGSLITAELAAEQGREVYAVPGNIDSQYNLGNNRLIKEGASPLICIDDILEYLGIGGADEEDARRRLSDKEFEIFSILRKEGEMTIDEVCMKTGFSPAYVNPILAVMEMKGFISSEMGRVFVK